MSEGGGGGGVHSENRYNDVSMAFVCNSFKYVTEKGLPQNKKGDRKRFWGGKSVDPGGARMFKKKTPISNTTALSNLLRCPC